MNATAVNEGVKVQVSRLIRAKRQRVYEAWTRPEMLRQWYGPKWLEAVSVTTDPRVGGAYRIEMKDNDNGQRPEGVPYREDNAIATGTYQAIIPNEMLCFTMRGTWDTRNGETLVTILFKDADNGGTEVTLIHERFASEEAVGGYRQGWQGSLDKLASLCEA